MTKTQIIPLTQEKSDKKEDNYFDNLYKIDVKEKIEKKGNLSYLSWAWAWAEIKKKYPDVKRKVIKNNEGWLYHTDGKTCWVEVSITINDIEETEYLPIMDYRNNSIPLARVTANNVNTSIQRATTKAIARHGLGLYIYAGEDLPEEEADTDKQKLANISQDVKEDMQVLCEEKRKAKAEEYFRTKKKEIEECGSIEEIEAMFEEKNGIILKKLENYPNLAKMLNDCKETMFNLLDPNNEESK